MKQSKYQNDDIKSHHKFENKSNDNEITKNRKEKNMKNYINKFTIGITTLILIISSMFLIIPKQKNFNQFETMGQKLTTPTFNPSITDERQIIAITSILNDLQILFNTSNVNQPTLDTQFGIGEISFLTTKTDHPASIFKDEIITTVTTFYGNATETNFLHYTGQITFTSNLSPKYDPPKGEKTVFIVFISIISLLTICIIIISFSNFLEKKQKTS